MAVDTPVLERRTQESERDFQSYFRYNQADIQAEDAHNARIRDNYARLINPQNNIDDVFNRTQPTAVVEEEKAEEVKPATPSVQQRPYLVRNARADSDIFRADSAVNQRLAAARQMTIADVKAEETFIDEEEENEDLRPTATTIQYRTIGVKNQVSAKKASRFALTKNQKIAIVAAVAIIITLITLIIVNAVIIAGLNAEISGLDSELETITDKIVTVKTDMLTLRGAYAGVSDSVTEQVAQTLHVLNY